MGQPEALLEPQALDLPAHLFQGSPPASLGLLNVSSSIFLCRSLTLPHLPLLSHCHLPHEGFQAHHVRIRPRNEENLEMRGSENWSSALLGPSGPADIPPTPTALMGSGHGFDPMHLASPAQCTVQLLLQAWSEGVGVVSFLGVGGCCIQATSMRC